MRGISKKSLYYTLLLLAVGLSINRIGRMITEYYEIPLYLDSIGTMFTAALGGICPGMFVGFLTNMIGGLTDADGSTFYYGTINVLIALIAGVAAHRGKFRRWYGLFAILPFYLLLSIPVSALSYIIYDCQIAETAAEPAVRMFHGWGLGVFPSQILGDFCVEIPDKLISLFITFALLHLTPMHLRKTYFDISGREFYRSSDSDRTKVSSIKRQIAVILTIAGLAIVAVAFSVSYKTYMEAKVAGYPTGDYDMKAIRRETLLYSGKMISAVLGLLLCVISYAILLANRMVVTPLLRMAREMRHLTYDSEEGRNHSLDRIRALDISTKNEIEELYHAMTKTVEDVDNYIDKTNEQAKTISDLHVNIITTLADIVESRDETTGYHVKRTAEYSTILAKELRDEGEYTEDLTDAFIDALGIAAPLHDIGKVRIPDAILNKPSRLTDEEYSVIKTHTTLGATMLDNAAAKLGDTAYLRLAKHIALYHHEWWNGGPKGYPKGLEGEQIPLPARIMAVADVLDALLSKRSYKSGFTMDQAFAIMLEEKGTHFDPKVIDALLNARERIEEVYHKYSDETA